MGGGSEYLPGCGDSGGHSGGPFLFSHRWEAGPALGESASSEVPQILWVHLQILFYSFMFFLSVQA